MQLYESSEDYLERILMLKEKNGHVRSIDISIDMGYSKPSISRAVKKLKGAGYITIDENGNIELTKEGLNVANKIYERHQILTNYFISIGVPEEIAANDACKIEHDLSEETFNALKKEIENK